MNICLFTESFLPAVGGKEIVIHHLANSLCDKGCNVTVIAKKIPGALGIANKYRLARYWKLFPGSGRTGFDFIAAVITIIRENRKNRFDVINCHGVGYEARRVTFAKKFVQVPIVMTPHGDDLYKVPEMNLGRRLNKRYDRMIIDNLNSCDAITAISNSFVEELSCLKNRRIYHIPNGINTELFSNDKHDYLYNLLSLGKEKKIVLSVGRNCREKDYESGIRSFETINNAEDGKDLVYVIIGRDLSPLQALVSKLKLNNKVYLLAQQSQDNIIKSYQSAWCFFSPSIIEGLSLVSIEAMSVSLPLVLTEVPGNIDILRDNKCGIFVKKGNPESMAQGILYLASNDILYEELSKRAYLQSRNYDWKNIAEMYLDVYRNVVNS